MKETACLVLRGRVIRTRVRGREYARLSVRNSKELLKYLGRDVTIIVIIQQ